MRTAYSCGSGGGGGHPVIWSHFLSSPICCLGGLVPEEGIAQAPLWTDKQV